MNKTNTQLSRRQFLGAAALFSAASLMAACAPTAPVAAAGQAPDGAGGQPPDGAGGQPPDGAVAPVSAPASYSAVYSQSGGSVTKANQAYSATATDQSGVYVTKGGIFTLTDSTITTSGNTSSDDGSSFYGLNAAVLAEAAGQITLSNSTVTTSGSGANGVFATGSGSSATLSKVKIKATGDGGHGVMATQGGLLTLSDVDIDTAGAHSAPLATDRGGGTINASGGTVVTSGQDSPCIYSTGVITVTGGTLSATGSESAVIEGANSIILNNTALSSSKADKWGVMIYQSMSGDAQGVKGIFTMTGGSLANTAASGPLFYVTNSTGVITLKGVIVTAKSGLLLKAGVDKWGNSGSNGGQALLTADGQSLSGSLAADSASSIELTLQNGSNLAGAINNAKTAKTANLTLDSSSTWDVTADSYLSSLSDADGIAGDSISNITGNGYTVYYDPAACPALGGKTYNLKGSGYLKPAS